jgi:hypothetical protein
MKKLLLILLFFVPLIAEAAFVPAGCAANETPVIDPTTKLYNGPTTGAQIYNANLPPYIACLTLGVPVCGELGAYRDTCGVIKSFDFGALGTIQGCGTLGTIAMFTPDGTTIGDSVIDQDVTTCGDVTITDRDLYITNACNPLLATIRAGKYIGPNADPCDPQVYGMIIDDDAPGRSISFTAFCVANVFNINESRAEVGSGQLDVGTSAGDVNCNEGILNVYGDDSIAGIAGKLRLWEAENSFNVELRGTNITADREAEFADVTGIVAIDNCISNCFTPMRTTTSGDLVNANQLRFEERSSDPTGPAEGNAVIWMSDGTGAGNDGDIMISIQAGSTTKTTTLVDFSALP